MHDRVFSSRIRIVGAALVVVFFCGASRAPSQSTPGGSAPAEIPAQEIRRLRAKWVAPEDDKTGENDKIRRYESMLRQGRQLLREYPEASDLYMVRALMLQATRGLLILDAGEIDPEGVIQLAGAIVDSKAPPGWRIEADRLLTQVDLARTYAGDGDVAEKIEAFALRYDQTDMQAAAVMTAAEMAQRYRKDNLYKSYINRLKEEMLDFEGVGAFLIRHGQQVPRTGRSFRLALDKVGGGKLQLPRDAMGATTVVVVWDVESRRSRSYVKQMASFLNERSGQGIKGVGIALGEDEASIAKAAKEVGADFAQMILSKEELQQLVEYFGVSEVPFCFVLAADGRIRDVPHGHLRMRWSEAESETKRIFQQGWRRRPRLLAMRSGLSLADVLHAQVSARLKKPIRRLLNARLLPPGPAKTDAFEAVAGQLEALSLQASRDRAARDMLLVAIERWRAMRDGDNSIHPQWIAKAKTARDDQIDDAASLLADYYLTLAQLHSTRVDTVAAKLDELVHRYDAADLSVPVRLCAVAAAMETGADAPRQRYSHQLEMNHLDDPRARGLLREVLDQPCEYEGRFQREPVFTGLDGKTFGTPDVLKGKTCVIHFWSASAKPGSAGVMDYRDDLPSHYAFEKVPGDDAVVIAVNVDADAEAAARLAKEHPDWLHAICTERWFDPLLRQLDVTQAPSSWVLGDRGIFLVNDTAPDVADRLKDITGMLRYVGTWRGDSVQRWYREASKLWAGFQSVRAEKALLGKTRDLSKLDRFPGMAKWAVTSGADRAIARTAGALHRRIIDWALTHKPKGPDVSGQALEEYRIIWADLLRAETLAMKIHAMALEEFWPDFLPESRIAQSVKQLRTLHMRRGQVPDEAKTILRAVFGHADSARGHFKVDLRPLGPAQGK